VKPHFLGVVVKRSHVLVAEHVMSYILQRQNICLLCLIDVLEVTIRKAFLIVLIVINEIHFIGIRDIVRIDMRREYDHSIF
jgi:hypothetical protein